jgi:hypothetical protein
VLDNYLSVRRIPHAHMMYELEAEHRASSPWLIFELHENCAARTEARPGFFGDGFLESLRVFPSIRGLDADKISVISSFRLAQDI